MFIEVDQGQYMRKGENPLDGGHADTLEGALVISLRRDDS